jgi:8-oxo-dGTP pyrophosphatase MutT (NUDIX family)
MTQNLSNIEIIEVGRIAFTVEPWSWDFATGQRREIDRFFAEMQKQRSHLWNGRVLMLRDYDVRGGVLHGSCFETDYASFMAWRDWEFPDPSVYNIFPSSALRVADGAFLVGEMAPSTAGAGQVCLPGGTPDLDDILENGVLDIARNQRRELMEETGLNLDEFDTEPGWTMVHDRGFFALMKRIRSQLSADELRRRVLRHLAGDPHPEFVEIKFLRGPADFDSRVRPYLRAYLEYEWQR